MLRRSMFFGIRGGGQRLRTACADAALRIKPFVFAELPRIAAMPLHDPLSMTPCRTP
jgi:hypothetical protein